MQSKVIGTNTSFELTISIDNNHGWSIVRLREVKVITQCGVCENGKIGDAMPLIELNEEILDDILKTDAILLVDCWASYCGSCKQFAPVFAEASKNNPEQIFATLDTVEHNDLTKKLNVANIPSLLLFRDGILLFQQPGYYAPDKLQDIVDQAKAVDMDLVRADIAGQNSDNNS